jgi:Flp pilus assembly protein TadB
LSKPRLKSSRLALTATLLMILLGVLSILINTTLAAVLIVLGLVMLLFERGLSRRVERYQEPSD